MKDCTTFLKFQESALNKQAEAKRQGYEGNTNNAPASQQGNNRAPQGQDQLNQGHDNDGGYVPSKRAHNSNNTASAKVEQRRKEHNSPS
jgi:hypothetical protein